MAEVYAWLMVLGDKTWEQIPTVFRERAGKYAYKIDPETAIELVPTEYLPEEAK